RHDARDGDAAAQRLQASQDHRSEGLHRADRQEERSGVDGQHLIFMEHEHTPEAIRARLAEGPRLSYLRDWIYGGIDGSVTTFAIVTGVAGAHLSPAVILILGLANLLG